MPAVIATQLGWRRLSAWRARRRASPLWSVIVALILGVIALPILTIFVLALAPSDNIWPKLIASVLPSAMFNSLVLMSATGAITLATGTATAWLVTMYRFPGRGLLDRLLVLPLAIPSYIVAYVYGDLLSYAGPVQSALRSALGLGAGTPALFEVRSLWGAILILSAVLYPYVYLGARASFVRQSACALEVARTLGRTPMGAFWSVALPMARPALAAGVALVMMECLADLAAVQYLGVPTLTASIYSTWLQRSNIGGAAQLASVLIVLVGALFAVELWARGEARTHTAGRMRAVPFHELTPAQGGVAAAACLTPFILGFAIPASVLAWNTALHFSEALDAGFWLAARHSLTLASSASACAVLVALALAYARRVAPNGLTRPAARIAGLGYALPGTVLAIGLLLPLGALDNALDARARTVFGVSTGLLLTGSLVALTLAYVIRFLAVALGALEGGLARISPNLDSAARALGETPLSALFRVHLPLLTPALATGALLVFVDAMKELPATLLLRPFNYETLATHIYSLSSIEQFESAAPGSLMIVLTGLFPVLALHKAISGGRTAA